VACERFAGAQRVRCNSLQRWRRVRGYQERAKVIGGTRWTEQGVACRALGAIANLAVRMRAPDERKSARAAMTGTA
jgi:hypothetical protein